MEDKYINKLLKNKENVSKDPFTKTKLSKIQLIIVMITFGTIGVFVKNINLSSAEIALWRGIIAVITLFVLLIVSGRIKGVFKVKKSFWKLFLSGIAMGFNWLLLFEAYNHTSIALSTLSYYFAPTIIIFVSTFLFKEKITFKQIVCFLVSTTGLVMIIGLGDGNSSDIKGVLYGLAAACLYAIVVLFNKATGKIEGLVRTIIQFIAAIIVLIPYVYFTNGFHIAQLDNTGLVNLLILGVLHTGIIYYLYFNALSYVSGQQAAILSYIDPTVAVSLSVIILGESISIVQLIGGIILLGATFINEINLKQTKL